MSKRITTVHFDATDERREMVLAQALCGYIGVQTTTDARAATCKTCLSRLARGARERARPRLQSQHWPSSAAVTAELHLALSALAPLAPHAGFPPRMSAELWASSCKGGEHRRCGMCEICEWEKSAQLWSAVAPWNVEHKFERREGSPRWSSLSAALTAWVEFELYGRCGQSAMGQMLARLERGERGSRQRDPRRTDPRAVVDAADFVAVQTAVSRAYVDGYDGLTPSDCVQALLVRSGAIEGGVQTFEALSAQLGASEQAIRGAVRLGRRLVSVELTERGLMGCEARRGGARGVDAAHEPQGNISVWRDDTPQEYAAPSLSP